MKKFYETTLWGIELALVQCYRPDKGYTLLAFAHHNYTTWCLVAKEGVTVPNINFNDTLELLLVNVRLIPRLDDVVGVK